jgi:hypothetical protein
MNATDARKFRQQAFCDVWTAFVRQCRKYGQPMNQTIAAERMGIQRSTFSDAINRGPSDSVLLRFCLFSGVRPTDIEPSLAQIVPFQEVVNG